MPYARGRVCVYIYHNEVFFPRKVVIPLFIITLVLRIIRGFNPLIIPFHAIRQCI
jgi:hypothetical protein